MLGRARQAGKSAPRFVDVMGVTFDNLDMQGVTGLIRQNLVEGYGGWVVTPNVDIVRQVWEDADLRGLVGDATLVIVDGAPVEWAGQLAHRVEVNRVAGASLVKPLLAVAEAEHRPVLLLGGRPGSAVAAARSLVGEFPELQINTHCPPLGFEDDRSAWADVFDAVSSTRGGLVFCGLGFPKQERVMRRLSADFPDTWFLGVGGSIDFLAEAIPRAPEWMQRAGVEWVFRLATEPRRLGRRYVVDGIPFGVHLMAWALVQRHGASVAPMAPRVRVERPTRSGGTAPEVIDLRDSVREPQPEPATAVRHASTATGATQARGR